MVGSSFWTSILLDRLQRVPTTGTLSKRTKEWWQWDNGDPITYANWLPNDFFSESLDASERDYVVMTSLMENGMP